MKHHLYQIYFGGFKHKIAYTYYCSDCFAIITSKSNLSPYHKLKLISTQYHNQTLMTEKQPDNP